MAPGEGLVVGVSGGVDSVVLLDVLHRLAGETGWRLHVAHLDHGLREASGRDADAVRRLARQRGLEVDVQRVDVAGQARAEGISPEDAGRRARRAHWRGLQAATSSRWTVLAHHADDQAETLLLRLLRGAGLTGLAAMRPAADEGILRPLLDVRRQDLTRYADDRGLKWREDPSNVDRRIPRNRVRHEVIPSLEAGFHGRVVDSLARTAGLLQVEDDFLQQAARQALGRLLLARRDDALTLDIRALRGYHMAIQRRVLRQCIQELARNGPGSSDVAIRLQRQVAEGSRGLLPVVESLQAQITDRSLILRRPSSPFSLPLTCPGQTPLPGRRTRVSARLAERESFDDLRSRLGPWRAAFDEQVTSEPLHLRSPRRGDRIRLLGLGGRHKRLSDCFIDAKWPRILRDDAVVLCRGEGDREELLWVAGLARSDAFVVTPGTDRILCLDVVEAAINQASPAGGATG